VRVLITGGSGYIGRHAVAGLIARGHEVHIVSRGHTRAPGVGVQVLESDLLEPGAPGPLIERVRPDAVLHLAWQATPGIYWTSPDNPRWAEATAALAQAARDHGAVRFVGAGSSAEYDWTAGHCDERTTAMTPATPYGRAKLAAGEAVSAISRDGFTTAWGRVFFLFGGDEHPSRLVPSVALAIARGEPARCSHGEQQRDFHHVEDVAGALVALLESDVTGAVNIASGDAHRVRDVVEGLATRLGRPDLVHLGAIEAQGPLMLTAGARRLRDEVGWRPRLSFDAALDSTAEYWRSR